MLVPMDPAVQLHASRLFEAVKNELDVAVKSRPEGEVRDPGAMLHLARLDASLPRSTSWGYHE